MFRNKCIQNNLHLKVSFSHVRYFLIILRLSLKRQITLKIISKSFDCHVIGSFEKRQNVFKLFFLNSTFSIKIFSKRLLNRYFVCNKYIEKIILY